VKIDRESRYPGTVEHAVRLLLDLVPPAERDRISLLSESDLPDLHLGLGLWLRNNFGLWAEDSPLKKATGEEHADDASEVVIRAFWGALQTDLPRVH
jgi:hypothetical protein